MSNERTNRIATALAEDRLAESGCTIHRRGPFAFEANDPAGFVLGTYPIYVEARARCFEYMEDADE